VILVTGAGSAIGRATAIAFAREGARLVVADFDPASAEETARRAAAGEALVVGLDVTQPAAVEATVAKVVQRYGRLDVLACIAGVLLPEDALLHETDPAVWDRTFGVNVTGTFLCCRYAVRQMLAQGGGVIVNTAAPFGPLPGVCPVYDASATAVAQLTRVVALQHAAEGIRCNAVAPGGMATPPVAHSGFGALPERPGRAEPAGRPPVQPEEVAAAFVFLASDDSSYLTGVEFPVDAGLTARSPLL
jgi:NAD(P)-dependent dehydrogenase (short-subunit alcohol dehydrogenase family)